MQRTIRNQGTIRLLSAVGAASLMLMGSTAFGQWSQWGGPNRDFMSDSKGLADKWPDAGPEKIWSRELGAGLSSVVVDGGRLFTMYREGDNEFIVALNAKNGETVWSHKYSAPLPKGVRTRYSTGPNSTPLVVGDRIYTVGFAGRLTCLNKATGKTHWSHDLMGEYQAKPPHYGFSSSPVAHENKLIVAVGGEGCGMMAFDLDTGSLLWKRQDFQNIYSSPLVIKVGKTYQVVLLHDRAVVGVDVETGDLKWSHEHENQWRTNISSPLWDAKNRHLYVTAGGEAGSRVLKLTDAGGKTTVDEIWANRKMGVGQGNVLPVGNQLIGCAGSDSGSFMTAIDAKTGEIAYRERGFKKSMLLHADGKIIALDEDGNLSLANASSEKYEVRSNVQLFKSQTWTVPTLVGKTLYLRGKNTIMALNLGR